MTVQFDLEKAIAEKQAAADSEDAVIIGDDGFKRTRKQARELDLRFARVFRSRDGQELLKYLRAITLDSVSGPELSPCALRHLEGRRFLVSLIQRAVDRGRGKAKL